MCADGMPNEYGAGDMSIRDDSWLDGPLGELAKDPEVGHKLRVVTMDFMKPSTIYDLFYDIKRTWGKLDLLINATGVLHTDTVRPETSMKRLTLESLQINFQINTFGPALLVAAMEPVLRKSNYCQVAKVASLSARVGSIADNRLGGWYSYRASKAALNQLTKTMANEFKMTKGRGTPVVAMVLHPGTVDTKLSKPFQSNVPEDKLFDTERAARQLLEILDKADESDNGKFFAWDGQEIPW